MRVSAEVQLSGETTNAECRERTGIRRKSEGADDILLRRFETNHRGRRDFGRFQTGFSAQIRSTVCLRSRSVHLVKMVRVAARKAINNSENFRFMKRLAGQLNQESGHSVLSWSCGKRREPLATSRRVGQLPALVC